MNTTLLEMEQVAVIIINMMLLTKRTFLEHRALTGPSRPENVLRGRRGRCARNSRCVERTGEDALGQHPSSGAACGAQRCPSAVSSFQGLGVVPFPEGPGFFAETGASFIFFPGDVFLESPPGRKEKAVPP